MENLDTPSWILPCSFQIDVQVHLNSCTYPSLWDLDYATRTYLLLLQCLLNLSTSFRSQYEFEMLDLVLGAFNFQES